jgi:hypothetical protein
VANRPTQESDPMTTWITAEAAAQRLGIKRATLDA